MRYMDIANWLVASPALSINTKTAFDAVSVAIVALRAYQHALFCRDTKRVTQENFEVRITLVTISCI